ncbi:serine/threonine-protein kinase Aurora-2 [Diachasma alloeum]|uniref:serine/threonine-protein kinase Aurora-2 n=1 Tax=Diachasma alloeum TaxID=454923 RepID=UPI00073813A1|nr:serine/threonine-protein kinase Aurora-2 [Diachasma alloeum]
MWYFNVKTKDMLEGSESMMSSITTMENPDVKSHHPARRYDENNQNVENSSQEKKQWTLSDFSMGKKIAQGSFGIVYSAKEKHQNVVIAIKVLFKTDIKKRNLKQQVLKEIEIHSHLKHPNILRMYGWFQDEKRIYMVMELTPSGDLLARMQLEPWKKFSEPVAASYLRELTEAIKYIHKKQIIHRDVKLENLLLDKDDVLKLTDFGWAVHTPTCESFSDCGVRENMAPEMLLKKPYDYAVDVWGIGVVGFQMIAGVFPFFGRDKDELVKRITNVGIVFPDEKYFSDDARNLISKLIVLDPNERLTLDEITNHNWIVKNR